MKKLLYTEPPVTESALHLVCTKEPVIVERYIALKEEDMCLVDVAGTGLHVRPKYGFLAGSPDRLVEDSSCEPSHGLLEVKYLASVSGPPSTAIGKKANFCLERLDCGTVRLKRSHNYFYQVQDQMGCTGRQWCDFVCHSLVRYL